MSTFLSPSERSAMLALATAALPAGRLLPGADGVTVNKAEALVGGLPSAVKVGYRALVRGLDVHARLRHGRSLASLPLGRRLGLLDSWAQREPTRTMLRGVLTPLKLAHFDDPGIHRAVGCQWGVTAAATAEKPRWQTQVMKATDLDASEALECDVVVVGTGAGGAPVAHELAAKGYAVLLLEQGEYHSRTEFTGKPQEMMRKLYVDSGFTLSLGNTAIPIPLGRAVGGTTLINSGTCLRAPDETLVDFRDRLGLAHMDPAVMAPLYDRVDQMLGVAPSPATAIGPTGRLIARGCDALGFSHSPLPRNAPGCDGQGVCCFGCPTDAKRATSVSWVPAALEKGAQLITGIQVEQILLEGETAVGVVARVASPEAGRQSQRITVRARAVVLACGTVGTSSLLLRQGLCNASDQLGRNLSIHPATYALGLFDEDVFPMNTVPQGYAIDEFEDENLVFEGASTPLALTATAHSGFGPGYMTLMERYNRLLHFGFMVKDTSRGRVSLDKRGKARMRYWLNATDVARLHRGVSILARVMVAAGAREVHLPLAGQPPVRTVADIEALERSTIMAHHVDLSAYHPLGTARMGMDPMTSVVDATHETHDVHNLFVCDGSAMPGSLGANPQITIMAMALQASVHIARRLERLDAQMGSAA